MSYVIPGSVESIFYDPQLVPSNLIKNYHTLVTDIIGTSKILERSIIFKELQNSILELETKEREYLKIKYGLIDGIEKSLVETGKIKNVTNERVRQLIERALGRLSSKKCKFHIVHRIEFLKAQKRELEKEIDYYEDIILYEEEPPNITINDFDFGLRAYNSLMSKNITTYDQLMSLTKKQLIKIPNIGKKSAEEIWYKLHGEHFNSEKTS